MEHQHHEHAAPKKSFFERYQTFFSIIIAGLLIGGGVILARSPILLPTSNETTPPKGQSEGQVRTDMMNVAKEIGLNKKDFGVCLDQKKNESKINDAVALANASGVEGTPTFFIITRTYAADGSVSSEHQVPVVGARDASVFIKAIETGKTPADQPAMPKVPKVTLTDTDHSLGPKNAAVTIVEYSDIDCPFCKRAKPTIEGILKNHPEYAFVYRHSPIVQLHPWAAYKAQATECAFDQGGADAFWKFLNLVAA